MNIFKMKTFDDIKSGDTMYIRFVDNDSKHTTLLRKFTVKESIKRVDGLTEFTFGEKFDEIYLLKSESSKSKFWTGKNTYCYSDKQMLLYDLYNEKEEYIRRIDDMIESIGIMR